MRNERPRDCASGDWLHHGSFDLDKPVAIEKPPHGLHQFAAFQKDFANLRIHDQVDVSLPVTEFDIR